MIGCAIIHVEVADLNATYGTHVDYEYMGHVPKLQENIILNKVPIPPPPSP